MPDLEVDVQLNPPDVIEQQHLLADSAWHRLSGIVLFIVYPCPTDRLHPHSGIHAPAVGSHGMLQLLPPACHSPNHFQWVCILAFLSILVDAASTL